MILSMLLAYDSQGQIVATLNYMVAKDEAGRVVGVIDFDAHERAGGEMTQVWHHEGATGSKTWPEWIGGRAHDFRVELAGPAGNKRIAALVHKVSGVRRERAAVEAAIAARIAAANGEPADIRDIVGGPDRPLILDDDGRTKARVPAVMPNLPTIRVKL